MDLRELRTFVGVAEHGGFSAAAAALGITQPAVSGQMAQLEREVGERLFRRHGRGVSLTPAGVAALAPARAALAEAARVGSSVAELTGLLTGQVRLGHVASGATASLREPLRRFHRNHPAIAVSLVEDGSEALVARVLDGSLDLAWIGLAGRLPAGLQGRVVREDPLVVGVSPDHAWAGRRSVAFARLASESVVTLPVGTGARAALDQGCARADVRPTVAFSCSSPDLIAALVLDGAGVAVLPEPLAAVLGLSVVPLVRPEQRSRLSLVWAAGGPWSSAARAFLEELGAEGDPR